MSLKRLMVIFLGLSMLSLPALGLANQCATDQRNLSSYQYTLSSSQLSDFNYKCNTSYNQVSIRPYDGNPKPPSQQELNCGNAFIIVQLNSETPSYMEQYFEWQAGNLASTLSMKTRCTINDF